MDEIRLGANSRIVPFTASDGVRLSGILSSNERSSKCILFVHGMGGSAFSHSGLALLKYMPNGISVFSINTRGTGLISSLSKYKRGKRKRVLGGVNLEKFEDSAFDIRGAVNVLSELGYRKIILCGQSTGCQKIAYYQYKTNDRRIKGIALVAPTDDHNIFLRELGRSAANIAKTCSRMIKSGNGDKAAPGTTEFSAQRLDSIINSKRVEGRLFNYDGNLKEFSRIKTPILAIFGTEEENALKKPEKYLEILESKSSSKSFSSALINGGNHIFYGTEKQLVKTIQKWVEDL